MSVGRVPITPIHLLDNYQLGDATGVCEENAHPKIYQYIAICVMTRICGVFSISL